MESFLRGKQRLSTLYYIILQHDEFGFADSSKLKNSNNDVDICISNKEHTNGEST